MDITSIFCAFKDLIYPIFGVIIAFALITRVPGITDDDIIFDEEECFDD